MIDRDKLMDTLLESLERERYVYGYGGRAFSVTRIWQEPTGRIVLIHSYCQEFGIGLTYVLAAYLKSSELVEADE